MFSVRISEEMGEGLTEVLGVRRVEHHAIYLSLPAGVECSRADVFRVLQNRVTKNLKD